MAICNNQDLIVSARYLNQISLSKEKIYFFSADVTENPMGMSVLICRWITYLIPHLLDELFPHGGQDVHSVRLLTSVIP